MLFASDMEGALVDPDQFEDNNGVRVGYTFTATVPICNSASPHNARLAWRVT